MSFDHGLHPGDTVSNDQLMGIFKCSNSGGMRRSHWANALVIISDHTKAIYKDRWEDKILHYTGMGLRGDQKLNGTQNKTLAESANNGVEVFLFEVFESGRYVFVGQANLAEKPYREKQPDKNGVTRSVWVFPLKLVDEYKVIFPHDIILKSQIKRERVAKRLTDDELKKRVKYASKKAGQRQVTTTVYERNEDVVELTKRRANGVCQLCESLAPFLDKNGEPFLECHHIVWLSKNGGRYD